MCILHQCLHRRLDNRFGVIVLVYCIINIEFDIKVRVIKSLLDYIDLNKAVSHDGIYKEF